MRCYDFYDSPHGRMLLVASGEGLTGVYFDGQKYHASIEPGWREDPRHAILRQAGRELAEYFAGGAQAVRDPARAGRDPVPARCLAGHLERRFWQDHPVWRAGDTGRISRQLARRRRGHRPQSAHHHRSLPPHRRLGREPDRIRRRPGKKARAAGARRSVRRVADSRPAGYLELRSEEGSSPMPLLCRAQRPPYRERCRRVGSRSSKTASACTPKASRSLLKKQRAAAAAATSKISSSW